MRAFIDEHHPRRLAAIVLVIGSIGMSFAQSARAGGPSPGDIPPLYCGAYVTNTLDHGPGSLRDAVATPPLPGAVCFDVQVFHVGAPEAKRTIVVESPIIIATAVHVEGPGASAATVTNAGQGGVIVVRRGVQATLAGISIAGGNADSGGGIFNEGTLALERAVVRDNQAFEGGGLYNAGTLRVRHTLFIGNGAFLGGAIFDGYGGDTTLLGVIVESNSSTGAGGGIAKIDGDLTIEDSRVQNNVAPEGGGIFNRGDTTRLARTRVEGNQATSVNGGGMVNTEYGATVVELLDCVVTGNAATTVGGGVFNDRGVRFSLLGGSVVTGNTPDDVF